MSPWPPPRLRRYLTRVEITSGLSEGDLVALPAEDKPLSDGAAVKVIP